MFYTSYFIILVQFSFVKRKKQQTVRSRSSPGCLLFMIWKENNGRNSFVCSRAALPIAGRWSSCCTNRLPCDMANARWGFRAGSGSSALLRCPASASALGRASRCTNRLPCDMANARLGLSCGKRKQRPLAVPCIRFGPWAGLALHESFAMRYGECSFGAFVREAEAAPSCGALHPLRPLSGPRVLQTAAPKISPCFCRWQRSKF